MGVLLNSPPTDYSLTTMFGNQFFVHCCTVGLCESSYESSNESTDVSCFVSNALVLVKLQYIPDKSKGWCEKTAYFIVFVLFALKKVPKC